MISPPSGDEGAELVCASFDSLIIGGGVGVKDTSSLESNPESGLASHSEEPLLNLDLLLRCLPLVAPREVVFLATVLEGTVCLGSVFEVGSRLCVVFMVFAADCVCAMSSLCFFSSIIHRAKWWRRVAPLAASSLGSSTSRELFMAMPLPGTWF